MLCLKESFKLDKIILKRLEFYGFHGLFPEENKLGQRFNVDVVLFLSLKEAGKSDQMTDSVDYGQAYNIIKKIVEGEAKNLLESVAETIADQLLDQFDSLMACQ